MACACSTMLVIKSGRSRRPHFRIAIFLAARALPKNGVHFGHTQLRGEKRAGGAGFGLFSGPKARAARQRRRAGSSSGWRQRRCRPPHVMWPPPPCAPKGRHGPRRQRQVQAAVDGRRRAAAVPWRRERERERARAAGGGSRWHGRPKLARAPWPGGAICTQVNTRRRRRDAAPAREISGSGCLYGPAAQTRAGPLARRRDLNAG